MLAFIQALAEYEREPNAVTATEADLLEHGFGENPYYFCIIAELDGVPAGFSLYFYDYSTWLGRPGLYLEDLLCFPSIAGWAWARRCCSGWPRLRSKRVARA